jgi:hypothetical protein
MTCTNTQQKSNETAEELKPVLQYCYDETAEKINAHIIVLQQHNTAE